MVGRRERWCYAAGDLGFNFVWQTTELYLLFYFIRGLGMSAPTASAIFLAGSAIDWASDPVIGALADRMASRVPLRAWVLVGGPLSCVMLALAFATPPVTAAYVPVWALVVHLGMRVAYSIGNIPYAALTARLSDRPEDHLALTSTRMQGAALGGLIAAGTYALLPTGHGAGADFRTGALILVALAVPAFLVTYFGTHERVPPHHVPIAARHSSALSELLSLAWRSAPAQRLILTVLAAGLTVTVVHKSLLFLFEGEGARQIGFYVALAPSIALLVTAPPWSALAARFGGRRVILLAASANLAALAVALPSGTLIVIIPCMLIAICACAGMSIMFWALVPAVIADCELVPETADCVGKIYALTNMARKLAQALAPQVIAASLWLGDGMVLTGAIASAIAAIVIFALAAPADTGGGELPLSANEPQPL